LVFVRAQARLDLIDLADFIAQDNPEAAERFIDVAEDTFRFLSDTPGAGCIHQFFIEELRGVRMWPIRGFEKHLVFYREISNGVEIIRVIHGARDIPAIFEEDR